MSARFALLVGVSDYRAFDLSAGQPRGTSDLYGPPQNLAAMWDFCLGLGYPAADIGLLASPLVPPRGGHPALYAAATRETVLDGVRALAERLASSAESQGLIWFSGHGDELEGVGPVLCTEDTELRDGTLRNVVTLAEIAAILETHAPGRAVTLVLDSCSSGMPSPRTNRTLGRLRGVARLRDGDTLISATGPGQVGVEIQVDGVWRGALTWALCAAAAPYTRKLARGFLVPDLSVASWVNRARLLLRGVSVTQRPEVHGDGGAVVLQPTGVPPIRVTNRLADQRRGDIEIFGDESGHVFEGDESAWMSFTLRDTAGNAIGRFVTSYQTPPAALPPYCDFWEWSGTPWPDDFRMDFQASGTPGQGPTPTNLPPPVPMMAFPPGLAQSAFGPHGTSGFQVWGVYEASVPNVFLAYLLRDTTSGALKWLITWPGYSQRGQLLTALPSPGGDGGVELGDDGGLLYYARISSPPATLGGVVAAYDVHAAFEG